MSNQSAANSKPDQPAATNPGPGRSPAAAQSIRASRRGARKHVQARAYGSPAAGAVTETPPSPASGPLGASSPPPAGAASSEQDPNTSSVTPPDPGSGPTGSLGPPYTNSVVVTVVVT